MDLNDTVKYIALVKTLTYIFLLIIGNIFIVYKYVSCVE